MNYLICLILVIIPTVINAQHAIKGKIIDKNNLSLEAVTVLLLNKDSIFEKGATTNKNGLFEMNGITSGNHILKISSVSYVPIYYAISGLSKDMNIGTIVLEENTTQLDEVFVQANSNITKADRMILFPSSKQIASSANGIALLSSLAIPRLIVNQATNSVLLPGNETVELRINNVIVGNDEVLALPTNTIERVEYIDNPGLRYGNAKAVLNYITKRQQSGGSARMELNNSPMRAYGSDLFSLKVNYKKSEFGLSYMNDFENYYNYERENSEKFYFENSPIERVEKSLNGRYTNMYQNAVLNYNMTAEKTFLNITLKYQGIKNPHNDYNSLLTVSNIPGSIKMKDYASTTVHLPTLDIYLERTLTEKQKLSFNVVSTDRYEEAERQYGETKENSSYDFLTNLTSNAYSIIAEGLYEYNLKNGKLNVGLKHFQKWTNNDYFTDVLTNSSMKQNSTYLYSEYTGNIRRLNYVVGVGGKRSWYSQNDGSSKYSYYNFQPTLSLFYKYNDKGSFRYRLNIYNDIPSLAQLTDVDVVIDSLQIRRGNPNLKPGMSYNNMIITDYTFNKLYLSLRAEHWYSSNFVQDKARVEGNTIIRSYQNSARFQRFTFDVYGRLSLFADKLVLSADYGMHNFLTADHYRYTVPYYYLNAQFNYKNWQFYGMMYDQGAGFTGEIKYIYGRGNNVGVQYKTGNYLFGAMLSNVFTDVKMTTKNISSIVPSTKSVYEKDKKCLLILKFAMNFDFGRKFNSGQQKISNNDPGGNSLSTGK